MIYHVELLEEWLQYADEDEEVADVLLREDGPINPICFHAQQMAEKYLKGFIVYHGGRFEKTHQLDHLLHLCEEIRPDFRELTPDIEILSEFYTETRYPGDIPEFVFDECKKGLEAAKRVKRFVLDRITAAEA